MPTGAMQAPLSANRIRSRLSGSNVFVCEFITGGGCCGQTLPAQLAAEGDGMLGALLSDFDARPEINVQTTRDARLPPLSTTAEVMLVDRLVEEVWETCLAKANAFAWWIAPETGGLLEHWVRRTASHGVRVFGCAPEAIAIAADKIRTFQVLDAGGIEVIPASCSLEALSPSATGWVVKPRDGAGCEATYWCPDLSAVARRLQPGAVVQRYIPGTPASLSLLCANGRAQVLACNRQNVVTQGNVLHFLGVEANAFAHLNHSLEPLAQRIAKLLPGLWGFVGVDLILTEERGPVVVEINPRITSAYPCLQRSLGLNLVDQILALPEPYWWAHHFGAGQVGAGRG